MKIKLEFNNVAYKDVIGRLSVNIDFINLAVRLWDNEWDGKKQRHVIFVLVVLNVALSVHFSVKKP